ncbi:MAG: long-chain acyl-CoA synthetase [Burkholderiales bacterium]|nr:MAG: long-chain acyl-CoA synthetase [Burkholderiales bacterium]
MSTPIEWLLRGDPGRDALLSPGTRLTAGELAARVREAADALHEHGVRVLATLDDNGPDWAVADLAAWHAGVVHVPLPAFFTAEQVSHVLAAAGVDAVATGTGAATGTPWAGTGLRLNRTGARPVEMPAGTVKVSFTSGSTGRPKGACLSGEALGRVAEGVATALAPIGVRRHLAVLPLAVLLENIAGLYAPLAAGASVVLPPLAEVGLQGSSRFDPRALQAAVARWQADSVIVLPQMLRAWAGARAAMGADLPGPRLVAVGGAAVGAATIAAARATGLAAYEGYGLTECGSVQTLNLPGADRPGSAGRPLPHAAVRIGRDGEVEVSGAPMLGYLGVPGSAPSGWWATGDLGRLDEAGFLHLSGRRGNLLITAFGRNVSPEWVETALQSQPAIAHAVVLGDARPALLAVLWSSRPDAPAAETAAVLAEAVERANATLPDYARVRHWVRAERPFDPVSGTATPNGRPLRGAIESLHRAAIAAAYDRSTDDVIS